MESLVPARTKLFLKNAIFRSGTDLPQSSVCAQTFLFKESASGRCVSLSHIEQKRIVRLCEMNLQMIRWCMTTLEGSQADRYHKFMRFIASSLN